MKILFLPGSYTGPAARFRVWQFVKPLQKLGHEIEVRVVWPGREWSSKIANRTIKRAHQGIVSFSRLLHVLGMLRDASKFDVVFMNKDIIPEIKIDFIEILLSKLNPRLIFDFDDAVHLGPRGRKLRKILPHFAWITPGNEYLAAFARECNPHVSVWPTVVDTDYYQPVKERTPGPIRIGWSGSKSTMEYCLPLMRDILMELSRQENFEFIIIAEVPPSIDWPGVKWRYIPWTPQTEVQGLQKIDIGVMPLKDEPFERGKCGLKAIQYMGVGIPTLVSPVGVNKDIVLHGENGFHASMKEEWMDYLSQLLKDGSLRRQMGINGRKLVEERYSVRSQIISMIDVFNYVIRL